MKRKIISFILSLTLIVSLIIPMGAIAEDSQAEMTKGMQHLINLGIMGEEYWNEGELQITRGEFASLICDIARPTIGGYTASYSDLDFQNPYYNDIAYCVNFGYMNGFGDGTFRPDEPITLIQAAKIFIVLAGYNSEAYYKGGYPNGYLSTAKRIGLLTGVDTSSLEMPLTRQQAAEVTYSALCCDQNIDNAYDSEGQVVFTESGVRVVEYYLDVKYVEGIVNANGIVKIANVNCDENQITIGQDSYEYEDIKQAELLGHYVEAYYTKEDKKIASIVSDPRVNNVLTIRTAEITSVSSSYIEYERNGRSRNVGISNPMFFVNGVHKLSFNMANLKNMVDTEVYLISNTGNSTYNLVFINTYTNLIVGSVSKDEHVVDKYTGIKQEFSHKKTGGKVVGFRDTEGNPLKFEDIDEDSVLSILDSDDFILVKVSYGIAEGKIDLKDRNTWTIGKTEYLIADSFKTAAASFAAGQSVIAYLDAWNEITYAVKQGDMGLNYGFLYQHKFDDSSSFADTLQFKIFTTGGEMKVYETADTFMVGSTRVKVSDLTAPGIPAPLLVNGSLVKSLIAYKVNSNNKIIKIELPKNSYGANESGFYKANNSPASMNYNDDLMTMDSRHYLSGATITMQVPSLTDWGNEDLFELVSFSESNETALSSSTFDLYYYLSSNEFVDVVVMYGKIPTRSNYANGRANVALDIFTTYDSKTEKEYLEVEYLSYDGKTYTARVDKDYNPTIYGKVAEMGRGDMFRLLTRADGSIVWIQRYYDYDGNVIANHYPWEQSSDKTKSNSSVSGYIATLGSSLMRIAPDKAFYGGTAIFSLDAVKMGAVKIIVVGKGDAKTIRMGTSADVAVGSRVCTHERDGVVQDIVIYEE